jgi:hypothetical protein
MKKTILIILVLTWISSLIVLTIALTDLVSNNPFKDYKLIIGFGFIAITGFIRKAYQKLLKTE